MSADELLIIAAERGNAEVIKIVAEYASHLTDEGRDALVAAIGECYSPTRIFKP